MATSHIFILATALVALAACGGGGNAGDHNASPVTPEAEKTETGARALVLSWGRAIELKEYSQAYRMMGEAGARRWTLEQFRSSFADLGAISVALPNGTMEGAVGSS